MNNHKFLADCFSVFSERLYLYGRQDEPFSNIVKNIFYKQEGIELAQVKTLKSLGYFFSLESMLALSNGLSLDDVKKALTLFSTMVTEEYTSECIKHDKLVEKAQLAINAFKEFNAKKYRLNRIHSVKSEILKHKKQLSILNYEALKLLKKHSLNATERIVDNDLPKNESRGNHHYKQYISKIKNDHLELRKDALKKLNKLHDWDFHLNALRTIKKELRAINIEIHQKRQKLWTSISILLDEYLDDLKIQKISKSFAHHLESYIQLKKPLASLEFAQCLSDFCSSIEVLFSRGDLNFLKMLLNKFCYLKFSRNVFLENNQSMENLLQKFYYNRDIPPICHTKLCQYRNTLIPDCGESTLRNMINILLWDKQKSCLNVNKLIQAFPHVKKEVVNFYCQFNSFESILSQTAHNEWMEVCSNIENVTYLFPPCNPTVEIAPGFYNFKNIICTMFGVNTFENFINALKPPSLNILIDNNDVNKKIIMDFDVSSIEILFIERHFRTFEREQSSKSAWEIKKNFLLTMKIHDFYSYELFISCCLFVEGHELPEVIATITHLFKCNRTCLLIFLCCRLDLIESRENFCNTILAHPRFKYELYAHNLIRAIANSMPENQDHYDKKIRVLNLLKTVEDELELVC